ncbi:topoisomerase II-associated protein PAT1 [Pseudomassariella vexata]|uniref:Topoisomerase II-associated protein PAT1 n=1 Tax=Pseudomassariella vexata TaxID=1141098 RepID=A0A1Y2E331_9PEZI|nr:topoisomerase II-associated protein PAT1 [Pseudomassariella vexata]ORY65275.1 topoisomerase II-associated protein PAT1 [Pseudomassariella vexata]
MAGHNMAAPGFSQSYDPFAELSRHDDDADALDFEDTYDGLGDQLDETDDAFNDDTFGGEAISSSNAPVGRDFDFFGSTAKVANAMEEEYVRFNRQPPAPRAAATAASTSTNYGLPGYNQASYPPRPARTGYEKYKDPEPTADLQVDASIWGTAPKKAATPAAANPSQYAPPPAGRKMMSLEEVEAAMHAAKPAVMPQPQVQAQHPPHFASPQPQVQFQSQPPPQFGRQDSVDYRYQQPEGQSQVFQSHDVRHTAQAQGGPHGHPITILQRPSSKPVPAGPSMSSSLPQQQQHLQQPSMSGPTQILQNPSRMSGDAARMGYPAQPTHPMHQMHRSQNSFSRQPQAVSHPAQLPAMSDQDKATYLEAEARRAKRNHKIYILSKDNGLMTPHDKSFITRIQLQQLVSATGDPNEYGTDAALAEDFYYQVHSSLAAQRPNPSQPLNNFAQTYLFQTGNRHGGMRRHNRGPENHMQRMEQQVQRAVEAAKNKPKNKQLVIEGSLGKISFSNAKTPKPLLNIKRTESGTEVNRPASTHHRTPAATGVTDRKVTLRAIESVYMILMKMEDHERTMPPLANGDTDQESVERQSEWQLVAEKLNNQLWDALKVHEPIGANAVHPFIAFISYPKGKKVIPRVFRQLSHEQRTTILTLIVVHLDQLDVVQGAQVQSGEPINLSAAMRESIEAFSMAVMPCLFNLLNDTELHIVTAVLGIIIQKLSIDTIARTRIGISMLTMILSRAEIIKEAGLANEQAWQQWVVQFNDFFNHLEPTLPNIFPGSVTSGEDVYVWQFLAAIGIGASPDEQQRLVLAVKDRVMDTVALSKTLPADMAKQRLDNVNLFMRSIGLDVELLQ